MAGFATHTPVYAFYVETMAVDPSDIPGEETDVLHVIIIIRRQLRGECKIFSATAMLKMISSPFKTNNTLQLSRAMHTAKRLSACK